MFPPPHTKNQLLPSISINSNARSAGYWFKVVAGFCVKACNPALDPILPNPSITQWSAIAAKEVDIPTGESWVFKP
jgi:hypothetical protein